MVENLDPGTSGRRTSNTVVRWRLLRLVSGWLTSSSLVRLSPLRLPLACLLPRIALVLHPTDHCSNADDQQ
jgi:hypothetical protein